MAAAATASTSPIAAATTETHWRHAAIDVWATMLKAGAQRLSDPCRVGESQTNMPSL